MKIVFSHIVIYLIFICVTNANFFIFNYFISKYKVTNKKIHVWNIIEGILNGGIIAIITVIIYYWFSTIKIPVIFATFAFIVIRNWKVFLGALILPLVTHWFIYNNFEYPYIFYIVSIVLIMMTIWILNAKTWTYIYSLLSLLLVLFVCISLTFLLSFFIWKYTLSITFVFQYIGPLIFLTIYLFVYLLLLSFWKSANSLSDITIYDYRSFYRITIGRQGFYTFVSNNKINNGIFLVFSLEKNLDNFVDDDREFILDQFILFFEKFNPIFFKISKDKYGIFFSIHDVPNIEISIKGNSLKERKKEDIYYEIEKTIKQLNKSIKRKIMFGSIFYGIQEYDFDMAFQQAQFSLKWSKIIGENIICTFNPYYYKKYIHDLMLIKKLNKEIMIGHISAEFLIGVSPNAKILNYYLSNPYLTSQISNISIEQIIAYSKKMNAENILIRYLAAESIKIFGKSNLNNKSKILFKYSSSLLSSQTFNIDIFINIIKFHNLKPTNIVLILKFISINKYLAKHYFKVNLSKLMELGVEIAISNIDINKSNILKKINSNYLIINNNFYIPELDNKKIEIIQSLAKKINCKIIATQISSKKILKHIMNYNIDILFGDYIEIPSPHPIELTIEEKRKLQRRINGN